MKIIFNSILNYLKDWKNWLVHAIVGIVLLVFIIWVPLVWWIKLIILALVVVFNCLRMKISKNKKEKGKQ